MVRRDLTSCARSAGLDASSVINPSIRVLVADDDPEMRAAIVDFLGDHGVRAVAAAGRLELTRHLAECSHDLVVLDLQFGQGNDLTLLPEIRPKSAGLAIIGTGAAGIRSIASSSWSWGPTTIWPSRLACGSFCADPGDPAAASPTDIAATRDRVRALSFRRLAAGPPLAAAD